MRWFCVVMLVGCGDSSSMQVDAGRWDAGGGPVDPCASCSPGDRCLGGQCCSPQCGGAVCGQDDGCLGTCQSGSGCIYVACDMGACGCSANCPDGTGYQTCLRNYGNCQSLCGYQHTNCCYMYKQRFPSDDCR